MDLKEAAEILNKNGWVAEVNPVHGLWSVGLPMPNGAINVLGYGPDIGIALQMALKTVKPPSPIAL